MYVDVKQFTPSYNQVKNCFALVIYSNWLFYKLRIFGRPCRFKLIGGCWVEFCPDNVRFKCDPLTNDFLDLLLVEANRELFQQEKPR